MSLYLDDQQQQSIQKLRARFSVRSEWPTWLVIVIIYGGWFLTLKFHQVLGLFSSTVFLILLCSWYMSLQHELLHGHPTRWLWFNHLLGFMPLAVWYPYRLYREQHLRHHQDQHLTHPALDPESNYIDPDRWAEMGRVRKSLYRFNRTLVGRMLVGPLFAVQTLVRHIKDSIAERDGRQIGMWVIHALALTLMLYVIQQVWHFSALYYVIVISYSALSLAMIRSFYEHRAAAKPCERIVINEAGLFFRLLYLNNNYHLVHHDLPRVPWFALRGVYLARRQDYMKRSGYFYIQGYLALFDRYAFKAVSTPPHPQMDAHRVQGDTAL